MKNKAIFRTLISSFLAVVMIFSCVGDISAMQAVTAYAEEFTPPVEETPNGVKKWNDISLTPVNIAKINSSYIVYGFTERHSEGYCTESDSVIPIEADYGLTAEASGMILYVNGYNHTNQNITIKSSKIDGKTDVSLKMNTKTKIDTKNMETGYHYIRTTFSNGKSLELHFWVNTDAVRPCTKERTNFDVAVKRRKALTPAIDAAINSGRYGGFARDGSKSLALDQFYYPQYDFSKPALYRCDTQRWIDQSNKIVENSWSAEHKAYALMIWMRRNIAYDYYMVRVLKKSRAAYAKDWSGRYSVYNINAGKCWDFASIYSIMCRAQGIPCTTIGADSKWHVWNIVLINGRWIELDLTALNKYGVFKAETSVRTIDRESYCITNYAFKMHPSSNTVLPDDITVNYWLVYGDPKDENNYTHALH